MAFQFPAASSRYYQIDDSKDHSYHCCIHSVVLSLLSFLDILCLFIEHLYINLEVLRLLQHSFQVGGSSHAQLNVATHDYFHVLHLRHHGSDLVVLAEFGMIDIVVMNSGSKVGGKVLVHAVSIGSRNAPESVLLGEFLLNLMQKGKVAGRGEKEAMLSLGFFVRKREMERVLHITKPTMIVANLFRNLHFLIASVWVVRDAAIDDTVLAEEVEIITVDVRYIHLHSTDVHKVLEKIVFCFRIAVDKGFHIAIIENIRSVSQMFHESNGHLRSVARHQGFRGVLGQNGSILGTTNDGVDDHCSSMLVLYELGWV